MARMRVSLDRKGDWVSPAAAALRRPDAMKNDYPKAPPPSDDAPVVTRRIVGYRAERDTWGKSMTAWELARLLDMAMGLSVKATPAEFAAMPADLKQHFMPVWEEVTE